MLDAAPALARTPMRLTFNAMRLPDWLRFDRRDLGLAVTLAAAVTVVNTSSQFFLLRERSVLEIAEFIGLVFVGVFDDLHRLISGAGSDGNGSPIQDGTAPWSPWRLASL